jgi:hypothetical protein
MSGTATVTPLGTLGAAATWSASNQTLTGLGYQYSEVAAEAYYVDALTFSTASAATVTFHVNVDGSSSTTAGTDAYAQYGVECWITGCRHTEEFLRGQNASATTDFTMPVSGSGPQFFTYYLMVIAGNDANPIIASIPSSGDASADFFHTMRIAGYSVYDASGQDITSTTSVTSALGFDYAPITTAPEPTSIVLIATGLVGVAPAVMRKRRTSPLQRRT